MYLRKSLKNIQIIYDRRKCLNWCQIAANRRHLSDDKSGNDDKSDKSVDLVDQKKGSDDIQEPDDKVINAKHGLNNLIDVLKNKQLFGDSDQRLNKILAKPKTHIRRSAREEPKIDDKQEDINEISHKIDDRLVLAAKGIAKTLSGEESKRTENELLKLLKLQTVETDLAKQGKTITKNQLESILTDMKIVKDVEQDLFLRRTTPSFVKDFPRGRPEHTRSRRPEVEEFEGDMSDLDEPRDHRPQRSRQPMKGQNVDESEDDMSDLDAPRDRRPQRSWQQMKGQNVDELEDEMRHTGEQRGRRQKSSTHLRYEDIEEDESITASLLRSKNQTFDTTNKSRKPRYREPSIPRQRDPSMPRTNLFTSAESLGIFEPNMEEASDVAKLQIWNRLLEDELEWVVAQPSKNGWEELIKWTEEGKLWKYPINNEQGLEAEEKVPFYEHVLLDQLLEDFPKTGPVRKFMELVILGLSQNPYITVERKHATVHYYRQYFNEKEELLRMADALG